MKEEECIKVVADTPDFIMALFWVFLAVIMLSIILGIIIAGSSMLLECYQERRRDYLRTKQMKIELERMEKQQKEDSKST